MLRPGPRAAAALALALVLGVAAPAVAGAPTDRLRDFFASINRVIADPTYEDRLPERLAAMRALVADIVDFRNASSIALGIEWSMRTTSEREEFARLFGDLLQTSLFASVGGRARLDNGLSVSYIGELDDAEGGVTVATTVLTRSGNEMAVGYRMSRRQGRWMVHDVVIDGVSLVENYRAQFHKVMQRSSYAALVSEMRTRLAELGHPATDSAAARYAPTPVIVTAPITVVAATPASEAPAAREVTRIPAAPAPVVVAAAPVESHAEGPAREKVANERIPSTRNGGARSIEVPPPAPAPVAVAPPTTPRAMAQRAAHAGAYWVQVGAFRNAERAIQVATALREHAVSLMTAPDQPLMRVLIGPFTDRVAAASALRVIRARGYEAFIAEAPE